MATIYPYFIYCVSVWGFTHEKYIERLNRLHRRSARLIYQNRNETTDDIFKKLKWLNFRSLIKYYSIRQIFKSINGLASLYMKNMFPLVSHNKNTRYRESKKLYLFKPRLELTKRTLFYNGVKMFNDLNINHTKYVSLSSFTRFLKTILFLFYGSLSFIMLSAAKPALPDTNPTWFRPAP